ncbi:MAG: tetratricopeptide repeat protein [Owenweeksia sp.]
MEKLQRFFLSLPFILLACTEHSEIHDPQRSQAFLDSARHHYQGNVSNMTYLLKAVATNTGNAEAYRELSIPYLKRGYPHLWFPLMAKTIDLDPSWTGARGYNYLFFYRDYERALADFRATDIITPGFTDFPQAMSIRYLKGLCFFGMEQYDSALVHFQEYIDEDTRHFGPEWVDEKVFIYRAIIYNYRADYSRAIKEAHSGLFIFDQSADLHYHKALAHLHLGELDSARLHTSKALEYFDMGYFHNRPYVEVQEQIYRTDIKELQERLN